MVCYQRWAKVIARHLGSASMPVGGSCLRVRRFLVTGGAARARGLGVRSGGGGTGWKNISAGWFASLGAFGTFRVGRGRRGLGVWARAAVSRMLRLARRVLQLRQAPRRLSRSRARVWSACRPMMWSAVVVLAVQPGRRSQQMGSSATTRAARRVYIAEERIVRQR